MGDFRIIDFLKFQNPPEPNSKEVFEDVLHRLQALGDKGKRVLIKLHKTMGVEYQEKVHIIAVTRLIHFAISARLARNVDAQQNSGALVNVWQ